MKGGKMFLGGDEIKPEIAEILRTQAQQISTSQLYEILKATIIKESIDIVFNQAKDWESVLFAKSLKYFVDTFDIILVNMGKKFDK